MHHAKLKAAVAKYQPLAEGKTTDELKALIAADEKGYSEEEVAEIIAKLSEGGEGDQQQEEDPNAVKEFELWDVTVKVTTPLNVETGEKERKVAFEKKGDKPVRTTSIEQRHADILNAQAENTKQVYYPKA